MFGKKKEERPKRDPRSRNLAQYGLFDVPSDLTIGNNNGMDDDDDDEDLEAELLALTSDQNSKPNKPPRRKPAVPAANLDRMIADSLKDIPSDEDLSGDDDDPDLLNELSMITDNVPAQNEEPTPSSPEKETNIVSVLEKRLEMYILAEQNAKKAGESSRARRFSRGIKTLKDLIKQSSAGKAINPDDIPPEVSTGENHKPADTPTSEPITDNNIPIRKAPEIPINPPTPEEPKTQIQGPEKHEISEKNATLKILQVRKDEYKLAALKAKKSGDTQMAIKFMKIGKQFDLVIKAIEEGKEVDLSNMPGSPEEVTPGTSGVKIEQNEVQKQSDDSPQVEEETSQEEVQLINPPTLLEGLQQRMDVYKQQVEKAQQEGNSSKARRMGRIIKQYEDAIKAHKNGKSVALDELPNPLGFVPLVPPETKSEAVNPPDPKPQSPEQPKPESSSPSAPTKPKPAPPVQRGNSVRIMGNQTTTTHNERQINMLLSKQKEFKVAALQAKQKGELAQAKEYLRTAKGFDKLIDAASCGLPVDMDSLPLPPSAKSKIEDSFELVLADECFEDDTGTLDILTRLEEQLTKQLKMCLSTRDHHKAIGDVAGMNRFENLALTVTKDLDIVRLAHRTNNSQVPKFHYENKSFSVVKCCTDLNDNDFELNIVRGISYNCTNPKDIDTYVKFEFPYPQEEPVRDKTATVKDTNNPEYNSTFTLPIQRTARPCLRVFKRHSVKLEVYSKGGFFKGDTLLGTVNIKLQPLETQCELHDSYDLMDGRKKVGGKLEVRLRVRNPLVAKQVEQLNEKWLILDH